MNSSFSSARQRTRLKHRSGLAQRAPNLAANDGGVALTRTALAAALLVCAAMPAFADGGTGGDSGANSGGAGGAGFTGNAGASTLTAAGGGGGGAGGGAGGSGGGVGGGSGGPGGTIGTPDGGDGGDAGALSTAGGGGGGGGFNGNGAGAATITNAAPLSGGNGGNGGDGPSSGTGGGGGGGAGGYGAIVTGGGASSNTSTITGGNGGDGGASGAAAGDFGGNGGDGGVGALFSASGVTFTNSGTVSGGDGGVGGAAVGSGSVGLPGAGGVGIIGADLIVFNSGTITGGLSGNGVTRANAITFTGGTNVLELQSGTVIVGNVVDMSGTGTLRLGGTTAASFNAGSIGATAQYQGFTTFIKTGTSTWTLSGTTTALTPWTINQGTLAISSDGALGDTSGGVTLDGGTLQFLGALTSNRNIVLNAGGGTFFPVSADVTLGGTITGAGAFTKNGLGVLTLSGLSSYLGATDIQLGTLRAGAANVFSSSSAFNIGASGILDLNGFDQTLASVAGAGDITLGAGTLTTGGANTSTILSGDISGTGGLTKVGTGTFTLSGSSSYGGATNVNVGVLQAGAGNAFSAASAFTVALGATLDLNGFSQSIGSLAGSGNVTLGAGTLTAGLDDTSTTYAGIISGAGGLTKGGTGIFTLTGANNYTGATNVDTGTLRAGALGVFATSSAFNVAAGATLDLDGFNQTVGSLAGAGTVSLGAATLSTGGDNSSTTFSGDITGAGGLTKLGTGIFTLSGLSTYGGVTNVNAGTLLVDGSIGGSAVTVNSGAILGGTGTVGATTVLAGATLAPGAPGSTLSVNGTLALDPASTYVVQVSPTASSQVAVVGTAALAGTAQAVFQPGSYIPNSYTIVTSAGLGGTAFDTLTTSGLPSGFAADLSYTATAAVLNLTAALGQGQGLNTNQQNVATAINNFFNGGGSLPPSFFDIFSLTGGQLRNALTNMSGEPATGTQQSAFRMSSQFLGLLLDPFVGNRDIGPVSRHLQYAQENNPGDGVALSYLSDTRKDAEAAFARGTRPDTFDRRFSIWTAGFGGTGKIDGNAGIGSHDVTASTYGVVLGVDRRVSSDTVAGFAISGGGTHWDLASGVGGGRSDVLNIGAYAVTRWGPAYTAAAFGFSSHWFVTDRSGPNGERIAGNFVGQSFGARLESGYRYGGAVGGITPYAALQMQLLRIPGYTEVDKDGGGFALQYNANDATDLRTEIGARFDAAGPLSPTSILILRSRLAWAHQWMSDSSLTASFQSLPGSSFIVQGATPNVDVALVSAGFEIRLTSGVSFMGKFDGEFGGKGHNLAGTSTLRYTW